ncbi:MAG: cupin domain-containing protein [Spirochaetales bacterium]|nr:cupin domain-containing protein [Spirochaetales bacterium]
MPEIFNCKSMTFKLKESPIVDFAWHTSPRLAEIVQSKHLYFDIRSLDPDRFSYPYHFHRNAEELFVILSGMVMLRTPDGFHQLKEGDIVFMETGPTGAHQLYNHTNSPCQYLDIRTATSLDVCEYPDSGKINILPYLEIYQKKSRVDYFLAEDKVREKWPAEIIKKK